MKKASIAGIVIAFMAGCVILGFFALQTVNINRIGTDGYFTKIVGAGKVVSVDGTKDFIRYEYELVAYMDDGKEEKLPFSAAKQLREGAYLKLFVKEGKGVTSYQEVSFDEIPEAAQKRFG
ncbi:YxeA family protein [Paenibacillus sp. GCM10027627]|uniref:YxeA family protein n=1 Tax=unclassified Paenibacillus TaxID=185978 RepID=UPI00362F242F